MNNTPFVHSRILKLVSLFNSAYIRALELRKNNVTSAEDIKVKNLLRFRELANYVYQKSPYYRNLIDTYKINLGNCTPLDFPVLTKRILVDNFDLISTEKSLSFDRVSEFAHASKDTMELLDNRFIVVCTSGSSELHGYFVYTPEEALHNTLQASRFFTKPSRKVAIVAISHGHEASPTVANISRIIGLPTPGIESRIFDCNTPLDKLVKELNGFSPDLLAGYAKVIGTLAEAKRRGQLTIKPSNVQVSGEPTSAADRNFLEQVFGCNVTNVYASSECLYMGFRRSDMQSMCLLEDEIMFEVTEEYICVTPLFYKTIPLIRYRMEDKLIVDNDTSNRQYPLMHIHEVIGRLDDSLELRNTAGQIVTLHPLTFSSPVDKYMRQMQIREISDTEIVITAAVKSGLSDNQLLGIESNLRLMMDTVLASHAISAIDMNIEFCEHIPADPKTGKYKIVIKNPNKIGPLPN